VTAEQRIVAVAAFLCGTLLIVSDDLRPLAFLAIVLTLLLRERERSLVFLCGALGIVNALTAPRPLAHVVSTPPIWALAVRHWALQDLTQRLGQEHAALITDILWSQGNTLDDRLHDAFLATGTMHILVTAGLHIGCIAALLFGATQGIGCGRITGALLTIPIVWLYAILSGMHIPVVRAASMLTLFSLARALGSRQHSGEALCIAAGLIALCTPWSIATLSFALSFSCVATIVALTPTLEARFERLPQLLRRPLALGIAVQCGTWPLMLAGFHLLSLVGPVLNLIVIPLVPLIFLGALTLLALDLLGGVPLLSHAVAAGCQGVTSLLISLVENAALLPWAARLAPSPPTIIIALTDGLLLFGAWMLHESSREAIFGLIYRVTRLAPFPRDDLVLRLLGRLHRSEASRHLIGALLITAMPLPVLFNAWLYVQPTQLNIAVVDVGQGDGIVITTPYGHTFLIDTGGCLELGSATQHAKSAEEAARRTMLPFLASRHIDHIDAMMLTHPHGDHVGGAAPIMRFIATGELDDDGAIYHGHAYQDAVAEALRRHIRHRRLRRGDRLMTDDHVVFEILAPFDGPIESGRNSINEHSLVIRLSYYRWSMLFMGDAGWNTEARLLATTTPLHADVLKVGHHGSAWASSDAFLAAVAPQTAVISVGRNNHFGHPAARTLASLQHLRAHIWRTDLCGTIFITPESTRSEHPCS